MSKLFIIEGLPGSGKSTFSKRLKHDLEKLGYRVVQHNEGDLHPIDLSWISIVPKEKFQQLLIKYMPYQDEIIKKSREEKNSILTAYTQVKIDSHDIAFFQDFSKYEIYKFNDLNIFLNEHLKLYNRFNNEYQEKTVYLFECVFLQNHINELILKYGLEFDNIKMYINTLYNELPLIKPQILYIKQKNVEDTIKRISLSRTSDNPLRKDWIDYVVEYFESTRYFKSLGYSGKKGVIDYFLHRQKIELSLLEEPNLDNSVFELDNDYDETYIELYKYVISQLKSPI
ncbi:hypothetical protein CI105_02610 [Candidatus Izimaplasma bacterium ZiA1]|uniref:hypothetical protein n=1 Tax=Candidatus Izimoplasma sp. ZiA1 TaxID=2024899 RepID=UPI000BAA4ED0|nr:hypothetical protein CI105_02610 [Candidatus Izimaplasma bacterium ZiA1]